MMITADSWDSTKTAKEMETGVCNCNSDFNLFSGNGDIYEGEWFNNKIQGRGVYNFSSGACYKGEFYNNLRNGEGEYIL